PVNPGNPAFTRYDIWRGSTAADAVYLANVTASVLTYNDTTVVNGNTYVYLVKAINTVGSSLASNAASTTPGTVPGTPTGVTATAYRGYITLGWTAPSGNPVNYLVYRGTTSEGEASTPIATTTATSYQDNSVAGGTKYFYEIKANNTHGMSAASAEVNATALAITAPTAPQDLTVTAQVDKLVLTWTAPGDNGGAAITGYQIFKSTSGGTPALLTTVSGSTLSYTDTAVSENTNYTYFVKAVNSAGAGTQSNSQTAVPESAATTDNTALYVGVGVVVLVIILGVGYYFLRKPKTPKP
ncbi:MAG TPA: fibronectin type III domain-containing protein, partial [Methanomassiliicoccales archaeon]|nr:fibronectin type III domain-containing protein [Methanomassiliicoccales archaeon]